MRRNRRLFAGAVAIWGAIRAPFRDVITTGAALTTFIHRFLLVVNIEPYPIFKGNHKFKYVRILDATAAILESVCIFTADTGWNKDTIPYLGAPQLTPHSLRGM